jgi:hypothetical protein
MNSFNQLKQNVSTLAKDLKIDMKATGKKEELLEKYNKLLKIKEDRERPLVTEDQLSSQ